MKNILQKIADDKAAQVAQKIKQTPLKAIIQSASQQPAPRNFYHHLATAEANNRYPVIAEIKQKSPSKGVICHPFNPAAIAKSYSDNGAACLSVLTDEPYFGGCDAHLQAARAACSLPVIRKDFMLCDWQIYESRAIGADAILLIAAILPAAKMAELANIAHSLGMSVILEVHDAAEMQTALTIPDVLIGINNRNLKTFAVDIQTTLDLLPPALAHNRFVIAESGIHHSEQVQQLKTAGAHAFLVGESIVNTPSTGLHKLFMPAKIREAQRRFLKNTKAGNSREKALAKSLRAAVMIRGGKRIYIENSNSHDASRRAFRKRWQELIIEVGDRYLENKQIDKVKVIEEINRISETLSKEYRNILHGRRLRIGISQKRLNLYLKFLWCQNADKDSKLQPPPHCPIDREILNEADIFDVSWTKLDCIEKYQQTIDKLGEVAKKDGYPLPAWELFNYNSATNKKK